MKPYHFLRIKGAGLMPFGLVLLTAPEWIIGLLDGEANASAVLFARLCGLLLLGMGAKWWVQLPIVNRQWVLH